MTKHYKYATKDDVFQAVMEAVEEIYSHPLLTAFELNVEAEANELPMMTVKYTAYVERRENCI